jgi:HK97 family phage major capsid protein
MMDIEQFVRDIANARHITEDQLRAKSISELQQERAGGLQTLVELNNHSGNGTEKAAQFVEDEISRISTHLRSRQNGLADEGMAAQRRLNPTAAYETGAILQPSESVRDYLRDAGLIKQQGFEGLGIGSLMRAMVTGARNPLERRALEELTDSAGGVSVPVATLAEFIDRLRSATVCVRSGARTLPLTTEQTVIAKTVTDPTAQWRLESNPVGESEPTFAGVDLVARSLAVLVIASRELLEDSLNVQQALELSLRNSFAVKLDEACLLGSGSPPEPQGVYGTANVNSVPAAGPLTSYDEIIDAMVATWENNETTTSAVIMSPFNLGVVSKLKEGTTSAPLQRPTVLQNIPFYMTTSMNDDTILLGNFQRMIIGIRTELRIEILKELFAQSLQYGFLCHMRCDVALEHAESFARITNLSGS